MPKATLSVLATVCTLVLATSAFAEIEKQKDEMTGITYVGIKLVSEDGIASLHFGCFGRGLDVDPRPWIQFSNSHFLTSAQNHFSLSYKTDENPIKDLEFRASSSHSSGLLDIEEMHRREAIFGRAPKQPSRAQYGDQEYKAFEKERAKWQQDAIDQIISDFVTGSSSYVRVWDYNGKSYTYKFDLTSMRSEIDAIIGCYIPGGTPSPS